MDKLQYRVLSCQDGWIVEFEGATYGPYATQLDAYKTAIHAAKLGGNSSAAGAEVVLVDGGQSLLGWTYGVDAFPLDYQSRLNELVATTHWTTH